MTIPDNFSMIQSNHVSIYGKSLASNFQNFVMKFYHAIYIKLIAYTLKFLCSSLVLNLKLVIEMEKIWQS